ncbi:hypothetical protein SUGI_0015600 [Cryptomeria japonica]|nr:hypothetical protein SUGI_0015600 [Cryptomeria japonica]
MASPSAVAIFFNLNLVSKSRVNSLGFIGSSSNGLLPMCDEFARKRFRVRFSTGTHEKERADCERVKVACRCHGRILHQHLSAAIVSASSQFFAP